MHQLTIEPLGETIMVSEEQTILDACLRAGIYLPHACGHGLCSTCKIQVLEGEVDVGAASPFALMDFEREEGKVLACVAKLQSDAIIEADIEEETDARRIPVNDYVGHVSTLENLTPIIKGIWLELEKPFDFQAGQYVYFHLPGIEGPRAFSVASPPSSATKLEFHIRKVENGVATTFLHEKLQVGDKLPFSGPHGRFFVRKSAPEPMIFVAGGSGLSAIQSIVLDLLEEGCTKPMTLFFGARNRAELYHHELFQQLVQAHANFSYVPALSEPQAQDSWAGETGLIHEILQKHFNGNFSGHKAYLCGPPPMLDACIRTLMQGRLFEKDIFTERFITAANAQQKSKSPLFKRL